MPHDPQPDLLAHLANPVSALAAALHAESILLSPAIVRAHPAYKHEILLVRPRNVGFGTGTDWTLPVRRLACSLNDRLAGTLRDVVAQDTGLGVRGVVGGGFVESVPWSRSSTPASHAISSTSATSSVAPEVGVFFVVRGEGAVAVAEDVYSEWMWAKAAEIPALQLRAEVKRVVEQALKLAGSVV